MEEPHRNDATVKFRFPSREKEIHLKSSDLLICLFLLQEGTRILSPEDQSKWLKAKEEACLNGTSSNSSLLTGEQQTWIKCCETFAHLLSYIQALPGLFTPDNGWSDPKPVVWFRQNVVVFSFFLGHNGLSSIKVNLLPIRVLPVTPVFRLKSVL